MNKNVVIAVVVVVLAVAGVVVLSQQGKKTQNEQATAVTPTQTPQTGETMEKKDEAMAEDVVTVKLTAVSFKFSQNEIRVEQGQKVKVELAVEKGLHNWVVDEFNAATDQVTAGNTTSVEFVASKKGTFEYYCSVGNHRQMGMVGKLIVE